MSSIIVFVVIAIAWAVLGSLKAAADKVGSSQRPNTTPAVARRPEKPKERPVSEHRPAYRSNQSILKMEDSLPDFGDKVNIEKPPESKFEKSNMFQEAEKKNKPMELSSLLKGKRLAESIILAECLDRPRAHRPHPLAQQQSAIMKRRG